MTAHSPRPMFAVGSGPVRLLRASLWVFVGVLVGVAVRNLLGGYPLGVDLEIPLRAASRWVDGGQPYLPESFEAPPGYDLPFLYPPFTLPLIAPLLWLPRAVLVVAWAALLVGTATWACRRLAIPWRWVPLVLLWPPFLEALLGGNVQILLFGAVVALLFEPTATSFHPVERDLARQDRSAWIDGFLGIANGAIKPSQLHPWVQVLRRRPQAALLGAAILGAVVLVTLPLTSFTLWLDWAEQVRRASDPSWPLVGAGIGAFLPVPMGLALTLCTIAVSFVLPRHHGPAWLGILIIAGSPSLRTFGLLFLLPAMLLVRREFALLAAFLIASYTLVGLWVGVVLVVLPLALGRRSSAWLEPEVGE